MKLLLPGSSVRARMIEKSLRTEPVQCWAAGGWFVTESRHVATQVAVYTIIRVRTRKFEVIYKPVQCITLELCRDMPVNGQGVCGLTGRLVDKPDLSIQVGLTRKEKHLMLFYRSGLELGTCSVTMQHVQGAGVVGVHPHVQLAVFNRQQVKLLSKQR